MWKLTKKKETSKHKNVIKKSTKRKALVISYLNLAGKSDMLLSPLNNGKE